MELCIKYWPGAKAEMGKEYTPLEKRAIARDPLVSYGKLVEGRIRREIKLREERKRQSLEERADLLCAVVRGRIIRNRQYMPSRNPKYKKRSLWEKIKAYF
ncbi:MAG: hypothetical protein DRP29_10540 [Thermodesulfobacteriota bacterium]|nr:MAG: hypothetical protein DRP29_10540 [Thermodesulfobacteriota bacterium]